MSHVILLCAFVSPSDIGLGHVFELSSGRPGNSALLIDALRGLAFVHEAVGAVWSFALIEVAGLVRVIDDRVGHVRVADARADSALCLGLFPCLRPFVLFETHILNLHNIFISPFGHLLLRVRELSLSRYQIVKSTIAIILST